MVVLWSRFEQRSVVSRRVAWIRGRDLAEELTLALRTVDWHLGRAYAKLGVGSRLELATVLGGDGPA